MLSIPSQLPVNHHSSFQQLDSSKLETFQSCERLYFFHYILGLEPEQKNHNLIFGSAWHKGMEELFTVGYTSDGIEAAMQAFLAEYHLSYPDDSFDHDHAPKNIANAFKAYHEYVEQYKTDKFRVHGVELSGRVPVNADGHELIYKLDSVVEDKHGNFFTYEHKTGSALFSWWMQHWITKIQIGTYTHAFKSIFGNKAKSLIIDAVLFQKVKNQYHRIPINLGSVNHEHWLQQVLSAINSLERNFAALADCSPDAHILQAFPQRTPSCVKYNRICPFYEICFNNINPLRWKNSLPSGYKREFWNPEAK